MNFPVSSAMPYVAFFLTVTVLAASACVPRDTTVEKGGVEIVVDGNAAIRSGKIHLDDGWDLEIDRMLVSLDVSPVQGQDLGKKSEYSCSSGSADTFGALVDVRQGGFTFVERGIAPGGTCAYGVGYQPPIEGDSRGRNRYEFGPGTTTADLAKLEVGNLDIFAGTLTLLAPKFGVARLLAVARKGAESKRVDLLLYGGTDATQAAVLRIPSGDVVRARFEMDLSRLFDTESRVSTVPQVRFDALAYADDVGDHDGVVTAQDLLKLPVRTLARDLGSYGRAPVGDSGSESAPFSDAGLGLAFDVSLYNYFLGQLGKVWQVVP